jgi:uncharacterized protein HemY
LGTGHHGGRHYKSTKGHYRGHYYKSGSGHHGDRHYKSSKVRHGRRSYYYISLPYHRYYYGYPHYYHAYPYYHYFSLPHYRYYYGHSYYYYDKPSSGPYYDSPPDSNGQSQDYRSPAPYTDPQGKTAQGEPPEVAEQGEEDVEYVELNEYLQDIADAFAARDYDKAVQRAGDGLSAEPDNPVLPFIHSQALFAGGNYSDAAGVLRRALTKLDPENREVFYPAGFYRDEAVLEKQIARLSEAVGAVPSRADLQLLLGYQLLGVGRYDEALKALETARLNYVNEEAAEVLIEVLEQARAVAPAQTAEPAPSY